MTTYSNTQWAQLLKRSFDQVAELGKTKGAEYSGDLDRLDNFRRAGADLGLPMEVIWRVYAGKHWDAISTYVRDLAAGTDRQRSEPIEGRAMDLVVYLLLFLAMLEERKVILDKCQPMGSQPTWSPPKREA